jgi:hypothetical protein
MLKLIDRAHEGRTMRTRRTVIGVVLLVAASALTALSPASADPAPTASPDPVVAHLAHERGVSIAEAQRRIGWQNEAPALAADVEQVLGTNRFGGVWIGRDDDRLKVGVVAAAGIASADAATVAKVAAARGLKTAADAVPVRYSLASLSAASDWLRDELVRVNKDAPAALTAGYTTAGNAVRLGVPAELTTAQGQVVEQARQRFGAMLAEYPNTTRVTSEACSSLYCDPPLRAGVRITNPGCTVGFLGRSRSDAKLYAFTAGHCVVDRPASAVYGTLFSDASPHDIGPRQNFELGVVGDMAIIRVTHEAGWRARAWVYVRASTGQDGVTGTSRNESYPILSDGGSTDEMRVCKSGIGQSTSCGRVKELGVTVHYTDRNITVGGLARTSYCSLGGDSGAPVFASNRAFGIHVAGADGCVAYYQGIREAENLMNVNVSFDAG